MSLKLAGRDRVTSHITCTPVEDAGMVQPCEHSGLCTIQVRIECERGLRRYEERQERSRSSVVSPSVLRHSRTEGLQKQEKIGSQTSLHLAGQ